MERQGFIDAIAEDPDALAPWQVYADWLLERGELRGELISLCLATEAGNTDRDVARRIQALNRDEAQLLSPRLLAQAHYWDFELWRGFLRRARVTAADDDPAPVEALEALFADPHAALLRAVGLTFSASRDALLAALLSAPRPSLRELLMRNAGPLAEQLGTAAPRLETLRIVYYLSDGATADHQRACAVHSFAHDALRRLTSSSTECPAICTGRARLPRLEQLDWTGGTLELLAETSLLFRPPRRLKHLTIKDDDHAREHIVRLVACPVLRQLESLEIAPVSDAAVEALLEHAAAFRHLRMLRIGGGETTEAFIRLRAVFPAALPNADLTPGVNVPELEFERGFRRRDDLPADPVMPPVSAAAAQLAAWRSGDTAAGEALLRMAGESAARFFLNKVPEAAREALVQQILARAADLERARSFSSVHVHVLRLAHDLWLEHPHPSAEALAEPAALAAQPAVHRLLFAALRRLPPAQQAALELRFLESLADPEIAEVIDQPLASAKARLREARIALQHAITESGAPSERRRDAERTLLQWQSRPRGGPGVLDDAPLEPPASDLS